MLYDCFFCVIAVVHHCSNGFIAVYRLLQLSRFGRVVFFGICFLMCYDKVFTDSTYRATGSESTSNFTAELKETVSLPDHTGGIVTDICIPKTFTAVTDRNNKLYFLSLIHNLRCRRTYAVSTR